jgi:hypothetical protein
MELRANSTHSPFLFSHPRICVWANLHKFCWRYFTMCVFHTKFCEIIKHVAHEFLWILYTTFCVFSTKSTCFKIYTKFCVFPTQKDYSMGMPKHFWKYFVFELKRTANRFFTLLISVYDLINAYLMSIHAVQYASFWFSTVHKKSIEPKSHLPLYDWLQVAHHLITNTSYHYIETKNVRFFKKINIIHHNNHAIHKIKFTLWMEKNRLHSSPTSSYIYRKFNKWTW